MDLGLKDKVAVVTGAAGAPEGFPYPGQGAETARLLLEEGAKVVLADLNGKMGEKLAEEFVALGYDTVFVRTDITRQEDRKHLVDVALETYGKIDILVNAAGCHSLAGQGTGNSFPNILEEDWDLMYDVHVKGNVFLTQEVATRAMIPSKGGRIVMVSSLGAHGAYNVSAYGTAKAAISWFTIGAAASLGQHGISVNCVSPGMILTPIYRDIELKDTSVESPEFQQMMKGGRKLDMDRFGLGLDVARAIVFLVSDLGEYVTAVDLNVSAGQVAYY
jgi:NAD(P)-dependent dehydrogenase (short-subunit alcohol dehydrogenase family)